MLHPSYSELMAVVNREVEDGEQPIVQSRYSIVKATAARAKEIIDARTIEEKVRKARIEAENAPKEKEKDNVKDNNKVDRNRIKSRSIDFTIVNNKNCKIVCCIELDDYTHNRENVKKLDNFKNELFKQVNIPLYRVKVSNIYNLEEIREKFKK